MGRALLHNLLKKLHYSHLFIIIKRIYQQIKDFLLKQFCKLKISMAEVRGW